MLAADTYRIHIATDDEARALRRLAELDSQLPLSGRVLVGEIDGTPAAAISLDDGRVVADPFRRTGHLAACLRIRRDALRAHDAVPSLRRRMLAAVGVAA
jgi:hypothetical protein